MLFHVTADTRWSDLPLSGTFVEMLKRIVAPRRLDRRDRRQAAAARAREVVPPSRVLDGFGAFGPPPPTARPVPAGFAGRATFDHPPGFYGPPEGLLAVNTLAPADRLAPTRRLAAQRAPRGLPAERAAGSARADPARARSALLAARRAGRVPARRRDRAAHAPAAAGGGRARRLRSLRRRCSPQRRLRAPGARARTAQTDEHRA